MAEMITCGGAQGPDPQDLETGALLAPPGHHWRSGGCLQSGRRVGDFSPGGPNVLKRSDVRLMGLWGFPPF
jgi:hypothetical protein